MKTIVTPKDSAIRHFEIVIQKIKNNFNVKKIKQFDEIISKWRKVLNDSDFNERKLEKKLSSAFIKIEKFDVPISFYPDEYNFVISWDINLASKSLIDKNKQVMTFNSNDIVVSDETINKEPFYVKIENPIIIISPCQISSSGHTVINGNHRIFEAKQAIKNEMQGYFIEDNEHLQWMTSVLMRNFYLMIQDCKTIVYFLSLPFWKRKREIIDSLNIWTL
jgi:hypothetical protein